MDSTYHVSATDLGHDNKQNNFFSCFPFSSFMLLWLLLKLLLDRQLWRKGGIAATCRWCCCLLFLLGFFSAGKKAEKLQHAWVWGQSTNGPPLSLLLRERKEHFHFSWQWKHLAYFWCCISYLKQDSESFFSSPVLFFSFLLHVMKR